MVPLYMTTALGAGIAAGAVPVFALRRVRQGRCPASSRFKGGYGPVRRRVRAAG